MSDTSFGSSAPWQGNTPNAGPQDVVTQLAGIVQQLTALVAATKSASSVTFGTVTLSAGTATVVPQSAIQSNSTISLSPTNASAAVLHVYPTNIIPGISFTITSTGAAAGTETFNYLINNPS